MKSFVKDNILYLPESNHAGQVLDGLVDEEIARLSKKHSGSMWEASKIPFLCDYDYNVPQPMKLNDGYSWLILKN